VTTEDPSSSNATEGVREGPQVVLVLGIQRRSGTNFLYDLICLHPDCARVEAIWEDFALARADRLRNYAAAVSQAWNGDWDPDGEHRRALERRLGEGVVRFLADRVAPREETPARYAVSKTPSVENLEAVADFPGARAIVIVRDGRDVVESGMRSFRWRFWEATRDWARAAERVAAARERGVPFLLVRYEDLLADVEGELRRIFGYLDLEARTVDFGAAKRLPVRGSSSFGVGDAGVNWRPVDKTAEFQPVKRWASWSRRRRERFLWLAGDRMRELGYADLEPPRHPLAWRLSNRLCDPASSAKSRAVHLARRLAGRG
jgi:hypothetical protein